MRSAIIGFVTLAALAGPAVADDCHSRIMIVLDRSCSMNDPPTKGGKQTKWELAGLALQKVTTQYQGQLDFGLIMFPDQTGNNCLQDGPIYVNVAPGQEATIVSKVMTTMPTGPCVTDIKPAIDQVATDPVFATPYSGQGARSFVLFISDGMQTCGGTDAQIATSFKTLYDSGYPSYIVGFGDGVAPAALDQFATAGGVPRTLTPDGGTRLYYQADDAQALDDALDHIVGAVTAEFVVCPGVPCPDGRCFGAGAQCQAGFCAGPTTDDGGSSTGGDGGSSTGGDGGSSTGGDGGSPTGDGGATTKGHATGGCGCRMIGAPPAGSALLLFVVGAAVFLLRRRRR